MANFGAIIDKNTQKNGILVLNQVNDAYSVMTPAAWSGTSGTSINLGQVAESNPNQTANETKIQNECGVTVFSDNTYEGGTTATLQERDKTKIDFLADYVKGRFYLEYKYCGIVDGKHQEHFQIVKVKSQYSLQLPGGANALKYEATRVWPDATVTITGTTLGLIETALTITIYCTGVAITKTAGFVLKETAVS